MNSFSNETLAQSLQRRLERLSQAWVEKKVAERGGWTNVVTNIEQGNAFIRAARRGRQCFDEREI